MSSGGFADDDNAEFMPFSVRSELRNGRKKKKYNSWLGEDEDVENEDEVEKSAFDALVAAEMGNQSGGGMFVAGGGLEKQLKTKKAPVVAVVANERSAKKAKKEAAVSLKQGASKISLGLSMLQKMGWKGESGLGKNGTGITQALDVQVRPRDAGLGMIDEKTVAQKKLERQRRGEAMASSSEDDDDDDEAGGGRSSGKGKNSKQSDVKQREKLDRGARWKKSGKAAKVQLKSAYDVMQEEGGKDVASEGVATPSKLTIIDLTGPGERVVTDAKQLYEKDRSTADYSEGVGRELRYNVDKLVDVAEVDLKQKSRRFVQLQKKRETVNGQLNQLKHAHTTASKQLAQVREAGTLIQRLATAAPDLAVAGGASDEAAINVVHKLETAFAGARKRFGEDMYRSLHMPDLLYALLESPLKLYFSRWPFEMGREMHGIEIALALRGLLETFHIPTVEGQDDRIDYWELFLNVTVVPPLRTWLVRTWDCKSQAQEAVNLVTAWKDVWDDNVHHYVAHEVVWQRLSQALDAWDPMTDAVPLHEWLHPWLLLLSNRMEHSFYPVIVQKLKEALSEWDPMDGSAHALLYPWRSCFTSAQLDSIATTRILPKLTELCSDRLSFSASALPIENTDVLEAVLTWHDWIPESSFLKMLARSVFPRIYRAAFDWLTASNKPSGSEIIAWYIAAKDLFPSELFENPKLCILFAHLLDVMLNVAVDCRSDFQPEILLVDLWADERVEVPVKAYSAASGGAPETMSFRAMIEAFAGERGILFMPVANRTFNDKPLYSFGGTHVYFHNQLVYAEQSPGQYVVVSLDHLAQLVQGID